MGCFTDIFQAYSVNNIYKNVIFCCILYIEKWYLDLYMKID